MTNTLNIRYDDTVHGLDITVDWPAPVCGGAEVPVCEPEMTRDPVDCTWCISILE